MNKRYIIFFSCFLSAGLMAQTFWTGPSVTVSKENFADWTLAQNQDALTENVVLTRANSRGLFNIATETEFDNDEYTSPAGTEWANGSIADGIENLTFMSYDDANDAGSPQLNQAKVVHLIEDDIYIDISFTAWTQGDGTGTPPGGGFSYTRSSDNASSVDDLQVKELKLFPNPCVDAISLEAAVDVVEYRLLDLKGQVMMQGRWDLKEKLDVSTLRMGTYLLEAEGQLLRFSKR